MTLNEYQEAARSTAMYPERYSIIYPALGLAGEAGECCEKVKKWLRDDKNSEVSITEERRLLIRDEATDALWYIANLLVDLGFTLEEAAQANVAKLKSRKERGTLHGSGDQR